MLKYDGVSEAILEIFDFIGIKAWDGIEEVIDVVVIVHFDDILSDFLVLGEPLDNIAVSMFEIFFKIVHY